MSTIYTKLSDKTLILSSRQSIVRQPYIEETWTEIRIGMFLAAVSSGDSNGVAPNESLAPGVANSIFFGLKDHSNSLPNVAGTRFIGISNRTFTGFCGLSGTGTVYCDGGNGDLGMRAFENGSSIPIAAPNDPLYGISMPSPVGVTAYCGFYGVRFVVTNRGAVNQAVSCQTSTSSAVSGTDYSVTRLENQMDTFFNPSPALSVAWNNGSTAYTIPSAFYLYNPFVNSGMRLSCMGLKVYA